MHPLSLQHGTLRFTGYEAGEGPLVLLLHGFPDTARSWHHQVKALAAAGYRAVALNLRGYEPSSQPADGDYSEQALASDVLAWLDQLGARRAHLMGHDWGAAIAYRVAEQAPERFISLTTLAVPHAGRFLNEALSHPRQLWLSWYMLFFQLRGVSDYWVARNEAAFLRWLWSRWSPGWEAPEAHLSAVIEQLQAPGTLRSALAYYRSALSPRSLPLTPARRAANRYAVPVPTLALTGERDHCIDPKIFCRLMYAADFPKGLQVEVVPGVGHFLQLEDPDRINQPVFDWLRKHES